MATDATGTPTSPDGLAKINPSVDAPSGVGQNSLADSIQTALTNNYPRKPAGIVSGEVPVWNGSAWVRSSVTNIGPTSLGSGTPDSTKFLRGDGTWAVVSSGPTITKSLTSASAPSSPADGDLWYMYDSLASPTFRWAFQYNASSGSAYKWEFIGGSAYYGETDAAGSSAAGSGAWGSAVGPTLTFPRSGDFDVAWGGHPQGSASGSTGYLGLTINSGTPASGDYVQAPNNNTENAMRMRIKTGQTSGQSVSLCIQDSDSTRRIAWDFRWMAIRPVRVS
ncbi:MAG: hypothetical protein LC118_08045 [Dehalococcoidia bacterium]|nr:hypothetical protein [Dehalococcoidia bacterium]